MTVVSRGADRAQRRSSPVHDDGVGTGHDEGPVRLLHD